MPLPCSFALVNVLAITTRLIVSAISCDSEQACNCVTDLPQVCFEASQSKKISFQCRDSCFLKNGSWSPIQQN